MILDGDYAVEVHASPQKNDAEKSGGYAIGEISSYGVFCT